MSGFNASEQRRTLKFRTLDPLAVKFGRVMSDPAMRSRCAAMKVGDRPTADVTEGFKVVVTRLEGGELAIEELA